MAKKPVDNIEEAIDANPDLQKSLEKSGVQSAEKEKEATPIYKVISSDTKIPVSSVHGKMWKNRRDQSIAKRKNSCEDLAWEEAIEYYNNNQIAFRADGDGNAQRNEQHAKKRIRGSGETENIVYANVSALVPAIYAKNPAIEITSEDEEDMEIANANKELVNAILNKKETPGINAKPVGRRAIACAALTNVAYAEIGFTKREESSEEAIIELNKLSKAWSNAKTPKELRNIEGKIMAIEEKVDLLRPSGAWLKFRSPFQLLRDPDAIEEGFSDCKWVMVWEFVPTAWLKAVYGQDTEDEFKSLYEPTHVLTAKAGSGSGRNEAETDIDNYTLLEDSVQNDNEHNHYGYEDDFSYKQAQRTKIWYVWDKVTRRVSIYNDKDWAWPVWVWDDPLHLEGFYPFSELTFYTDPIEGHGKSEITYYLDQQDAINEINHEHKYARQQAKFNLAFDKNTVNREDVEKVLKGDEGVAVGVDVPEGYNLKDFVQSIVPPSFQYAELFDKRPQFEAINRLSSVTGIMRGEQFKTNTTNKAIEQYTGNTQVRLDEKVDAVEDFFGDIGWKLMQLCAQFMDKEAVVTLIGEQNAQAWESMSSQDFIRRFNMQVVGGSSEKPTSTAKKKMAMEVGQVLGQFAGAAPQATTMIMMKMFRQAFSDVIIDESDWDQILEASMQPPPGAEGGQPGQGQPQQGGGEGQGASQPPTGLKELVQQLPPEAQQAFMKAVEQGVPPEEALKRISGEMGTQPQQPPTMQ